MSAIAKMEVVTTTVKTQKEVILAPVLMATNLTMMDILVKVCKLYRSEQRSNYNSKLTL